MSDTFPPDDAYDPWEDKWEQGIEEYGYEDTWMQEDVTLYNDFGFPIANSIEDWHSLVTYTSADELLETYNMDNLDIIRELEDLGLWDAEDWEIWRDNYSEM